MRRTIVVIATVAAVGGLLVGCSGSDEPATASPKSIASPVSAANAKGGFPLGYYESTTHVPGSEYLYVSFYGDGGMIAGNDHGGSGGTYVVDGQLIVISDAACARLDETAHYKWEWDGSRLTMKPMGRDGCVARETALAEMTQVRAFAPDDTFGW